MLTNKLISEKLDQDMRDWRHDIHKHPELGFEEIRTSDQIAKLLTDFGLEVHRGIGQTGIVAVLNNGKSGASIGLRADMDALEIQEQTGLPYQSVHDGKMHACGHDGHTAMLLGAAKHLADHPDFDGTVYFIFQPAEEHGRGALGMMGDNMFQRFEMDAIYAIHNMPNIPAGHIAVRPGPMMACEDNFEIHIQGKGTHAALPHLGIDPIVIGAEIVTALQTIIARRMDPLSQGVISVTEFTTDGTRNVIPDTVTLKGDTRSFTPDMQDFIENSMHRIVKGVCAAHGVEFTFKYSREFAATINTKEEAEQAARVAKDLIGPELVDENCSPVMASEDFGFMLQKKQGAYIFLGNGGGGPGGCGLHSPNYDFNDEILSLGATFWVNLVKDQLPLNK
ncbi:M20 aminoacylase family protein [Curvivirga sp.]|uniref:M20 aminoacylase family protein n=1 Tax=Curvivirga sp. TaxID=2856848 RepID=UPI003B5AAC6D